jgi:acyl carrier protein
LMPAQESNAPRGLSQESHCRRAIEPFPLAYAFAQDRPNQGEHSIYRSVEPSTLSVEEQVALQQQVVRIVAQELGIREDAISLSSRLTDDLGVGELTFVELVISVEDMFGIELSVEEWEQIRTVGEIVAAVSKHQVD